MQIPNELKELLDQIGVEYIDTIADRRGSLVLRVERDGKRCTLKLHTDEGATDATAKQNLLPREAEILSQIPQLTNHLYIDHGISAGGPWLLTREIDGKEVHEEAKLVRSEFKDRDQRITELTKLLSKVSKFYDELYAAGYLHGDVQPAHTYLERDKITAIDWGLARRVNEPNPFYKGGFVYFVAPEIATQMRDRAPQADYSAQAEVYALGGTLFLFYTGSLALDFGVPKAELQTVPIEKKLNYVIDNRVFSFEDVEADPHPALEEILSKALSSNPKNRFENPSMLYKQISRLVS